MMHVHPKLRGSAVLRLRARVVQVTSLVALVATFIGEIQRAVFSDQSALGLVSIGFSLACFAVSLWVLQSLGRLRVSGVLTLLGAGVGVVVVSALEGGITHPNVVALPLFPLFASFVAGRRFGAYVAVGIILTLLALGGQSLWLNPQPFPASAAAKVILHASIGVVATILVLLIASTQQREADAERRRLQQQAEELEVARDQALGATHAKSEFLANMSHELRTPMVGVLGAAELLANADLEAENQEHAVAILESGKALLALISDVLDFSKIEAGAMDLEPRPTNIAEEVAAILKIPHVLAVKKGLTLTHSVRVNPEVLDVDSSRLRQVLLNLVSNAIKFTRSGRVDVEFTSRSLGSGKTLLECGVADTGPGIPLARRKAMLEAFSQLDTSIARSHGGTGLGLAISARLCELMGGSLLIDESPSGGALLRFSVACNDAADEEAFSDESAVFTNIVVQPTRVLVVDDQDINRLVVPAMLKRLGYHAVTVVDGGKAALGTADSQQFDVILMDVQMPEIDGLEATRQLRAARRGWAQEYIIALTANVTLQDRERCREAGMDDFLAKPLRLASLDDALKRARSRSPEADVTRS